MGHQYVEWRRGWLAVLDWEVGLDPSSFLVVDGCRAVLAEVGEGAHDPGVLEVVPLPC